jgi:hypothetical protein
VAGPTITVSVLSDTDDARRGLKQTAEAADDMADDIKRSSRITRDSLDSIDDGASNTEKGMRGLSDGIGGATDVLGTFGVTAGGSTGQVVGLIGGFADLSAFVADFAVQIPPLLAKMGILTTATGAQTAATGAQTTSQYALNTAFLTSPIFLIIAGVIALTVAFVAAWKESETFRNIVTGAFDGAKAVIVGVYEWVRDNWPLLLAILTGPIGLAVLTIKNHWDDIKRGVQGVRDFITEAFGTVVSTITGMPGRIGSAASGMFDGLWQAFKSAVNKIIDGWNGLSFSLPSINTHIPGVGTIGGWSIHTPDIPRLALGGIATRPTLALIGEAGPEAVVPLNRYPMGNVTNVYNYPTGYRASEIVRAERRWEVLNGGRR